MGKAICINQIFYDQEGDEQYRILWISPNAEFVYWIGLNGSSRIPKKVTKGQNMEDDGEGTFG